MKAGPVGAEALRYWEMRQAALSNNLANTATPGFKAERVFARLLADATVAPDAAADFSPGSVTPTGRPLDVALDGDGFLVVETEGGERWTRGGSLAIDADGVLVDGAGNPVVGDTGPILLPPGEVEIHEDGSVWVEGGIVGRLKVERPDGDAELVRQGATLWLKPDETEEVTERTRVLQGHLEESNVDPVGALVEMIEIQRAYSVVQRSMQAADGMMETITTQIGRVG